jgi:hypothetical protein
VEFKIEQFVRGGTGLQRKASENRVEISAQDQQKINSSIREFRNRLSVKSRGLLHSDDEMSESSD